MKKNWIHIKDAPIIHRTVVGVRQDFLASLISAYPKEQYLEVKLNEEFYLIRHWDGNVKQWRIDIYPTESFNNYKRNRERFKPKDPIIEAGKKAKDVWEP